MIVAGTLQFVVGPAFVRGPQPPHACTQCSRTPRKAIAMTYPDIDVSACRQRQQRLVELMHRHDIDCVIVTQIEHVQYLAGPRFAWTFQPAAALDAAGRLTLVAPQRRMPEVHAADEVIPYEAQWHSTLRNDQRQVSTQRLVDSISVPSSAQLGVEFSCFTRYFPWDGTLFDIEPHLYRLRRNKDPNEVAHIEVAIRGTDKMYHAARELIRPGINELEVYNELQSVAVQEFGEPLTGTGNDYQCASRGGPPRDRKVQSGELYILDLGPAFRGYFADNARTIAVSDPTDEQMTAWQYVLRVFDHLESNARPGVSAQGLFHEAQAILDECPTGVFNHHLGHGIGLFPHEAPHLNPHWDDRLEVGDVFTAEPGLYDPSLHAGMRLENDYLVTESGIRRLTNFPLELKL